MTLNAIAIRTGECTPCAIGWVADPAGVLNLCEWNWPWLRGREEEEEERVNRGGPNEERTAAVPTYISLVYVCYSYLHHPIGSNIIPAIKPHESHEMSRVNRKKYITERH